MYDIKKGILSVCVKTKQVEIMKSLNEIVSKLEYEGIICKKYGKPLSILVESFSVLNKDRNLDRSILYLADSIMIEEIPADMIEDASLILACPGAEIYPLPKASRLIIADATFPELCNQLIRIFINENKSATDTDYSEDYYSNCPQFCALVHEILGNDIRNRSLCMQKLSKVEPAPLYGESFRFRMLSFHEPPRQAGWKFVIERAKELFRKSNICVFDEHLLIFQDLVEADKAINEKELAAFLKEYDAFLCTGEKGRYLSALPGMYYQTKETGRIAEKMQEGSGRRSAVYEDYCIFLFIEMCTSDHFRAFHGGKYHFYISQSLLDLVRYDRSNGTDNLQVLFAYLENNCQVSDTARQLFMHRNTLMKRLDAIKEITGENFDEYRVRERYLFSYRVVQYITRYKNMDIFPYGMN